MPRFERSRPRKGKRDLRGSSSKRDSKGGSSRRATRGSRTFEDHVKAKGRKDSNRGSKHFSSNRRDFAKTRVTCSSCGASCEVPFKPTSSKPVFCDECFGKKNKAGSDNDSSKDFEIIKQKLNKIMKALDIE